MLARSIREEKFISRAYKSGVGEKRKNFSSERTLKRSNCWIGEPIRQIDCKKYFDGIKYAGNIYKLNTYAEFAVNLKNEGSSVC